MCTRKASAFLLTVALPLCKAGVHKGAPWAWVPFWIRTANMKSAFQPGEGWIVLPEMGAHIGVDSMFPILAWKLTCCWVPVCRQYSVVWWKLSGQTGCLTPAAGGIHIAPAYTYILSSQPLPCSDSEKDKMSPLVPVLPLQLVIHWTILYWTACVVYTCALQTRDYWGYMLSLTAG